MDTDAVIEDVKHPQKGKAALVEWFKNEVWQLNYYRAHMLYFIVVILIFSLIVYGEDLANNDHGVNGDKLRYIDALFLCCSAMTTTGKEAVAIAVEFIANACVDQA